MKKHILSLAALAALATSAQATLVLDTGIGTVDGTAATNYYITNSFLSGATSTAADYSTTGSTTVTGLSTVPTYSVFTSVTVTGVTDTNKSLFTGVRSKVTERTGTDDFDQFGTAVNFTGGNTNVLGFSAIHAIMFDQPNWTAGSTDTATFDSLSSLSFVPIGMNQISGSNIAFAVRSGSTYYLSAQDYNGSNGVVNRRTLGSLDTQLWFAFDPTVVGFGITTVASPGGTGVAGSTLTDINSIGIIALQSSGPSNFLTGDRNISLGDFNADLVLTAVPEPSTFAALAGLGVLGFAATRRRRA